MNLGSYAFNNCNFTTLILGTGITPIPDLIIPDQVEVIEDRAFSSCTFNGYLTLGSGLQKIGYVAFTGVSSSFASGHFNKIYCKATEPPVLCKYLGVPIGSKASYRATTYWKNFQTIEEIEF